jgi:hypothetical protein
MAARNLTAAHTTASCSVQRYAPESNSRVRPELQTPGPFLACGSNLRAHRRTMDLSLPDGGFRARPSTFTCPTKGMRQSAIPSAILWGPHHPRRGLINVDGDPSFPKALQEPHKESTDAANGVAPALSE